MSTFILHFNSLIHICIDISVHIATCILRDRITRANEQHYIRSVLLPSPHMQHMLQYQSKYIQLIKACAGCAWNRAFIASFMPVYVEHVGKTNNAFSKHHIPYIRRTITYVQDQL
jgi:hypothetical protein